MEFVIGIFGMALIGFIIVKLTDLVEWLSKRNIPAFFKYILIAMLIIIALVLVIIF